MKTLIYTLLKKIDRELMQSMLGEDEDEMVYTTDAPDINPFHFCRVAQKVVCVGTTDASVHDLAVKAMSAKTLYNNSMDLYYISNETFKPTLLEDWEDVNTLFNKFRGNQERKEREDLEYDTMKLLQMFPELEHIPLPELYEYLQTYCSEMQQVFDFEIHATPVTVEKKSTWCDREWNRKNGYPSDFGFTHKSDRYRVQYITTLKDLLEAYASIQFYKEHCLDLAKEYNRSSTRFITSYNNAVADPWAE